MIAKTPAPGLGELRLLFKSFKWQKYLLPGLVFAILAIFVAYPVLSVLVKSLSVQGVSGWGNYVSIFSNSSYLRIVWQSGVVSLGVSICATILGLIIAVTVIKTTLPLRRWFSVAAVFPMIIPAFVATLAYIFLFGRNGIITYQWLGMTPDVYSWKSVFFIQTMDSVVTAFLLVSAVLLGVGSHLEDAARSLGASEWKVLTTVTLPLVRPGIVASVLLIFMGSMADFSTPLLVGGRFSNLASASYTQLIGSYNLEMSSTLNVILLITCLVAFSIYLFANHRDRLAKIQSYSSPRQPLKLPRWIQTIIWTVCFVYGIYILMQLTSISLASFTKFLGEDYAFTTEYFRQALQRSSNSLFNTLKFASVAAVVTSLGGIIIAYLVTRVEFVGRSLLDLMATLPFAIPGTLMGVGYVIAFNQPPLLLTGTMLIVVILTVVRQIPLGVRSGVSVLVQQDKSIEEASSNLGASRFTTFWRIIIPMARSALLVSSIYAFVSTIQAIGAIIFVIVPGTKLLSVDVFEAIYRSELSIAASLSVVMLLMSGIGMLFIYIVSRGEASSRWVNKVVTHFPV
jgi:iron(III) transport system permease protein